MVGQWNAQVGRHSQQLTLALSEPLGAEAQKVRAIPGAPTRGRRPRDARRPFVTVPAGATQPRGERALPSRDSRGRFVADPTRPAPRHCASPVRGLTRSHLENAILFVLPVIAMALYRWHLPPVRW